MEALDFDTVYVPLQIEVDEAKWQGVARKYWMRDVYYLPICIRKAEAPTGTANITGMGTAAAVAEEGKSGEAAAQGATDGMEGIEAADS